MGDQILLLELNFITMIKISEINFTQRFDDSMPSFSSEKRINLAT